MAKVKGTPSFSGAKRRGNPCGGLDCHGDKRLAMTREEQGNRIIMKNNALLWASAK
jgi:hypothetical protein